LADRLSTWEAARRASGVQTFDPIYIVSAEGGGIRAAYFTAMTLARIADECPVIANRIFAVSAVSGGSVGAAIYAAAVHQRPIANVRPCSFSNKSEPGPIGSMIEAIFENDYLTPLLARMLLPDLFLDILPFYLPQFDRQLGLEFSFENSFEERFGNRDRSIAAWYFRRRSLYPLAKTRRHFRSRIPSFQWVAAPFPSELPAAWLKTPYQGNCIV
jgi:hypothetical protein